MKAFFFGAGVALVLIISVGVYKGMKTDCENHPLTKSCLKEKV